MEPNDRLTDDTLTMNQLDMANLDAYLCDLVRYTPLADDWDWDRTPEPVAPAQTSHTAETGSQRIVFKQIFWAMEEDRQRGGF